MASRLGMLAKFGLITLIFLSASSFFLALASPYISSYVATPYSVTSSSASGLHELKNILNKNGFQTELIVTDPEAATNIKSKVIYTIIGPSMDYDAQAAITILSLLSNGSSVLIVDDFGKANTLLSWFFQFIDPNQLFRSFFGSLPPEISVEKFELYINTSAVVMDCGSYFRNPAYPVIKNFNDHYGILRGNVRSILTKFASSLFIHIKIKYKTNNSVKEYHLPLPQKFGFISTTQYSWLETDVSSVIDGKAKPDRNEIGGISFSLGIAIDMGNGGRMVILTDPDIFTNSVLDVSKRYGFDNEQFILDIFNWLGGGRTNLVIFDESRKAFTPENPVFGLAVSLKIINSFARYWIVAPLIPVIFLAFFIAYLPRRFKTEIKVFKIAKKKVGTSPYYGRYLWYMYRGGYAEAFKVVTDNLRRSIQLKLGITKNDWDEIIEELVKRRPDLASEAEKLRKVVEIWRSLIKGKKPKLTPSDYIGMFKFIRKIENSL